MPRINWRWFYRFKQFFNFTDMKMHYRGVFGSEMGQAVLKDLYRESGMGKSSFVSGQAGRTEFNEGKRQIFLYITRTMGMDPEQFEKEICDE